MLNRFGRFGYKFEAEKQTAEEKAPNSWRLKVDSVTLSARKAPMRYIDAHCHLTDSRVRSTADAVVHRALESGVGTLMMGGVDSSDWKEQELLQDRFPGVLSTSFGIHPWRVEDLGLTSKCELELEFAILEAMLPNADALGETGLDFHAKRNPDLFDLQIEIFRNQIRLAQRFRKPLVLHVVAAHDAVIRILDQEAFDGAMLVHSFSGSAEEAKRWCHRGALLSFSGTILKSGSRRVKEALVQTPLEQMLFETDYPDQSWGPFVNEPGLVIDVYHGASQLLQVPVRDLIQKTNANFSKIR